MIARTIFSSAQFTGYCIQIKSLIHKAVNIVIAVSVPLVIYTCSFFFGMTFSPLTQSPLLHFAGAIASFIMNLCTLILTFCFGFITGVFDIMRESLRMFPFAQAQLRVVIGLIFIAGLIRRFINILTGGQIISGSVINVFVPIVSGIALFFGADWLNSYYELQLSVAEQIYIGLGYPFFYYFQRGKEINLRKRKKPKFR